MPVKVDSSINGLLNLYKPPDTQSFGIINKLKHQFGLKKTGYTGTLDNFASGVMLVGVGQGTKIIKHLLEMDKEYKAEIVFGKTTDTLDRKGVFQTEDYPQMIFSQDPSEKITQIIKSKSVEEIEDVVMSFIGMYDQMPPQYSSKKINGKRASDLARAGETVELKPVPVTIHDIKILAWSPPDRLTITVRCSTGTYIRSLARDIAQKLGTVAYLDSLERISNGDFTVNNSIRIEDLVPEKDIIPLREAIYFIPEYELSPAAIPKFKNGSPITDSDFISAKLKNGVLKVIYNNCLIAVLERMDYRTYKYLDNFHAGMPESRTL